MIPGSRSFAGLTMRHAYLLALLTVAGCSADTIDVQRETSLPAGGAQARFVVILTPDEESEPAFRRYAAILAAELQAHGMVAVNEPSQARYAVMFDENWHSTPSGFSSSSQTPESGVGGSHGAGGFDRGGAGGMHDGSDSDHGSESSAHLLLDTVQGKVRIGVFDLTRPKSPQERVFHADVRAKAPPDGSDAIVGAMIKAALKDFPGKTQESYSVPVPQGSAKS